MSSRLFLSDDINNHNYTDEPEAARGLGSAGGCPSCCLFSSTANAESG